MAINILARAHRCQPDGNVPVIRRGDDHGVNALVGEQLPKIVVKFRLVLLRFLHETRCLLAPLPERIADGDGRGGIHRQKIPQQTGALTAHADMAELNLLARRVFARQHAQRNEVGSDGGNERTA
jgi:hypothetical protein